MDECMDECMEGSGPTKALYSVVGEIFGGGSRDNEKTNRQRRQSSMSTLCHPHKTSREEKNKEP